MKHKNVNHTFSLLSACLSLSLSLSMPQCLYVSMSLTLQLCPSSRSTLLASLALITRPALPEKSMATRLASEPL